MGKSDTLAFLRSGRMTFSRYETSDLRIRHFGDVVIVTGKLSRARTLTGARHEDHWQFMKVVRFRGSNSIDCARDNCSGEKAAQTIRASIVFRLFDDVHSGDFSNMRQRDR